MDATVWQIISIVGYSLSGILVVVALIMFFKMNILAIIGDLSGKTAAKQIQAIREENSRTGKKSHGPGAFNVNRGELTETIPKSKRLWRTGKTRLSTDELDKGQTASTFTPINLENIKTGNLTKYDDNAIKQDYSADGTDILVDDTQVLDDGTQVLMEETQVLLDETQLLVEENGTTVLDNTQDLTIEKHPSEQEIDFKIEKDLKIVHTNEII